MDRVLRIDLDSRDGVAENYISDINLTGTLRGITGTIFGDILVVETNNVERFDLNRTRVVAGGWPKALQTTGSGISMLPDGGFVHCSTGTDVVRTYSSSGSQLFTASSGIAGTTDVIDCRYSAETGKVLALFNGTTDTVRVYSSKTLSSVTFSYSNSVFLTNPRAADFKENGSVLIADGTSQRVIEIDSTGAFVQASSSIGIDSPNSILVLR